ncbi:hypothetical protein [Piscinibacter sakaiensis]|uniref:hypothetical protein n=1 Tax=Piscinibacter sakaiensis TaxID=1547922 RepID=UPI003AAC3F30
MSYTKRCQIIGTVTYREGDGVTMQIPPGPCEIEVTEFDATLAWEDGRSHGVATLPLSQYSRYLASGALLDGRHLHRPAHPPR